MSIARIQPSVPEGRPYLVRPGAAPQVRRSPLVLWHLLSLDAPTVAACWVAFVGWCAGVRLSMLDPAAMFFAVWILYAADRLLDAKPLFQGPFVPALEERHRFHHTHRSRFLLGIVAAILPLMYLLHRTADAVLHLYVLLACLLSGWLLLVHARHASSASAHRLPKELAVGVFFPAAVFIPTVARAPFLRGSLLPGAGAFAGICTLNCLFLYVWEHPRKRTDAHASTRWGGRHVKLLTLLFTLATDGSFLAVATLPSSRQFSWATRFAHPGAILLACSLSGALLLILHAARFRLSATALRSLADLVLLTPVPIWLLSSVLPTHR